MTPKKTTTMQTATATVTLTSTPKGEDVVVETKKQAAPPANAPQLIFDNSKEPIKVFFQQGAVKFLIHGDDLWKTLGAGNYVGEGSFDQLNDQQVKNWAEAAGLPVAPYDRALLKPVLNGILQETWYRDIQEDVPESCIKHQAERLRSYLDALMRLTKTGGTKASSNGNGKAREYHFKPQAQSVYRLKKGFAIELKGQQATLLTWFKKNKEGHRTQIVRDLEADGFRANQPVDRVVAYYLNVWSKAGWLERVGEQMPIEGAEGESKAAQDIAETPAAPAGEAAPASAKETPKKGKKAPSKPAAKPAQTVPGAKGTAKALKAMDKAAAKSEKKAAKKAGK